jgi:hemerythrin
MSTQLLRYASKGRSTAKRAVRPLLGKQHALGHEAIDRENRAIADWWLRAVNCEEIQFPFFLARLKKLLRTHFDHEAALMRQAGVPLCECHAREHRLLLELCDTGTALSRRNWRRANSLLRNKFPKLLREHIIGMDALAVLFINTNCGTMRSR